MDSGAKTNVKFLNSSSSRSLLLHVLDSEEPYTIAKAFLDCGQSHRINDASISVRMANTPFLQLYTSPNDYANHRIPLNNPTSLAS
jgi:hypothetical protein